MTGLERAIARNKEAAGLPPAEQPPVSIQPQREEEELFFPQRAAVEAESPTPWEPDYPEPSPPAAMWEDREDPINRMGRLKRREALRFPMGRDD